VQAPDRGVRIPRSTRPVTRENLRKTRCIGIKVIQPNGAIFNEGNRFSGLLHRHHDVEACLAELGNLCLSDSIGDGNASTVLGPWLSECVTEVTHQILKSL